MEKPFISRHPVRQAAFGLMLAGTLAFGACKQSNPPELIMNRPTVTVVDTARSGNGARHTIKLSPLVAVLIGLGVCGEVTLGTWLISGTWKGYQEEKRQKQQIKMTQSPQ